MLTVWILTIWFHSQAGAYTTVIGSFPDKESCMAELQGFKDEDSEIRGRCSYVPQARR
jgi:hypothetical protein